MKITRENYEPYFLDYLEGNLDLQLIDEFLDFLRQNPDLKEELQLFEPVKLTAEKIDFEGRHKLYRQLPSGKEEFENLAIAWMEGDMNTEDQIRFKAFIDANPDKKRELEIFLQTRLYPDKNATFRHKSKLYRKPFIRNLAYQGLRMAAVLLVALAIWTLLPDKTVNVSDQFTENGSPVMENREEAGTNPVQPVLEAAAILPVTPEKVIPSNHAGIPDSPAEHEKVVLTPEMDRRNETIVLTELTPKKAILVSAHRHTTPEMTALKEITQDNPEFPENDYLSDRIKEKLGLERFSFSKLIRTGLEFASDISGERFGYTTGETGQVVALSLDTRLLGLDIPVGGK